ncbi:hypothetical protein BKA64DRAFT_642251 [Cadophora sp. MPI-SDFR-AT-0126]|nr:hypothetical protein BKA64DRAFT_642251 [Leotiomycetes sp. MPI-SDFR-AT-0126]
MYISKSTMRATLLFLVSGSVNASIANFSPFTSPNGEGCVDPQGFRDCFKEGDETFVGCGTDFCDNPSLRGAQSVEECLSGCKMTQLQGNIVYSCEYQLIAVIYLQDVTTRTAMSGGVPFYPPPDGAEGDEHLPQSRPLLIDLSAANIKEFAADVESSNNCAILDKNASTCQSAFDIQLPDVAVVNSFKLPAVGTEEVTNLPRNAFTDVGNEVVTISLEVFFTFSNCLHHTILASQ